MPEVIERADLRGIEGALGVLNSNLNVVRQDVQEVGTRVESVSREQADTRQRLEELYDEFMQYVETDEWVNEVNKARQELSLVRQEIETKFGDYDVVRKTATGILQAVDVGIVRKSTIHTV